MQHVLPLLAHLPGAWQQTITRRTCPIYCTPLGPDSFLASGQCLSCRQLLSPTAPYAAKVLDEVSDTPLEALRHACCCQPVDTIDARLAQVEIVDKTEA